MLRTIAVPTGDNIAWACSPSARLLSSVVVAQLAAAQPCTELPILFIVQDKSGSMAASPTGGAASATNPSKWTIASSVVPQMASTFANRFRYGVMMYPGASTSFACTTGGVVQLVPVGSTGRFRVRGGGPGGGTPTAASLLAVRSYLNTISSTAPIYVLLITDGMPNCNLALDPATRAATTQTAGPVLQHTSTCSGASCCGLGPKDCLDNNVTVSAAALAAGARHQDLRRRLRPGAHQRQQQGRARRGRCGRRHDVGLRRIESGGADVGPQLHRAEHQHLLPERLHAGREPLHREWRA